MVTTYSSVTERLLQSTEEHHKIDDFKRHIPRWCTGCGNGGILTAMQKLCRDENLPRENTVFVSGIGCSSRFPHYMNAYGFHGLHGRALPVAEGIKMARPDLHVFVNTGDGDCCSIGAAHWIHAIRYNMDMTVILHDNNIYGLTKNQASPTSPIGLSTNTTPRGSILEPLNPLLVTLGIQNASFVAQTVDWIPELMYDILSKAYHHRGLSFIRVLQRCPEFVPDMFQAWMDEPVTTRLLTHENGLSVSPALSRTYTNQEVHDPSNMDRAREIASLKDQVPVGILYRNDEIPCYEDVREPDRLQTSGGVRDVLEAEFEKFTIWPEN